MNIVVTGYASLDYAVRLDRAAEPDSTATILSRPGEWPRLGGSPAYVCAALVGAGARDATPVSWVADDAEGALYRDALQRLGVGTAGVSARPGRTPVCLLAYQPDGGCLCFYHPGLNAPGALDDAQRALIAAADVLCLTVGPAEATREALALATRQAKVVWAVKADRRATPPGLATALAARADLIVHSRAESPFVAEALAGGTPPAARIETRGVEGVAIFSQGGPLTVSVEPIAVEDSTGAGDSWLGGFLAARYARGTSLDAAARAGVESVRALFAARAADVRT